MSFFFKFFAIFTLITSSMVSAASPPRIALMPFTPPGTHSGFFNIWNSRITDRIRAELFTNYQCVLISRHNSLALQSEKLIALSKDPKRNKILAPAADVLINIFSNPSDQTLRLEIVNLHQQSEGDVITRRISNLEDLRDKVPASLAQEIAKKLNLEVKKKNTQTRVQNQKSKNESIALLTPKVSRGHSTLLATEAAAFADIALATGVSDIETVERSRLQGILNEHFLKASIGTMPGTERALGIVLGADRFIEVSFSYHETKPPAKHYRVDFFCIDPIRGHVQATLTRSWQSEDLENTENWTKVFNQLLGQARSRPAQPEEINTDEDAKLREKEFQLHLKNLERTRYSEEYYGNLSVLSQCEAACALGIGNFEQLARLEGPMNHTHVRGWGMWPGCRLRGSVRSPEWHQALAARNAILTARNRDVFGPLAEALARTNEPEALYSAAKIKNRLGLYSEALEITKTFPSEDSVPHWVKIRQVSRKVWALMGLERYQEAIDLINDLGNFNRTEMLMAADTYHLMGNKQEEMNILWMNQGHLGYSALQYEIDLFELRAELETQESAIDYFRNWIIALNKNEPAFKYTYLNLLVKSGRNRDAHEFASVVMQDYHFKKETSYKALAQKVITSNGGKPLPLKSPAEVSRPPAGTRFEIHPIEWSEGPEELKRMARFLAEMWAVEIAVYPNVTLPKKEPLYNTTTLSLHLGTSMDYTRILRPTLSDGSVTRLHIFGRDVHATGMDSSGSASVWGGGISLASSKNMLDDYLKGKVAVLSGLGLRHPIYLAYRDMTMKEAGWGGMPYHSPCIFGVSAKRRVQYLPKLSPTSQRLYEKFDHKVIAKSFAQNWVNPSHGKKLAPIKKAFPSLKSESPKPLFVIKPPPSK